jgi:DNA gyrase/topoisomerase IV subunit B
MKLDKTHIMQLLDTSVFFEKIDVFDFMRLRPAMFLGRVDSNGILELWDELLCLFLVAGGDLAVQIAVVHAGKGRFSLTYQSATDWLAQVRKIDKYHFFCSTYFLKALRAYSNDLTVQYCGREYHFSPYGEERHWTTIADQGAGYMHLEFELDPDIFSSLEIDVPKLAERLRILSMLNPGNTFSFEDRSADHPEVEYMHSPEGLLHLYQATKAAQNTRTLCDLWFRGRCHALTPRGSGYTYEIALGFREEAGAEGNIRCFANSLETVRGGSLVDGIVAGIRDAIWAQFQAKQAQPKLSRKQIKRHLLLTGVVQGGNLEFHHPTRRHLSTPEVLDEAREIAHHLMVAQFARDPTLLDALLRLFASAVPGPPRMACEA